MDHGTDAFQAARRAELSGAFDEAETLWENARQIPESRYRASVALFSLYLKRRNFDAAERVLQESVPAESSRAEVLCGLARVATARGNHVLATRRWQHALATHPNHRTALTGLMRSQIALNKLELAAATAETLANQFPDVPTGPIALAQLAGRQGLHENAFERFAAAHAKWPNSAQVRRGLAGAAMNTGRWTQAEIHYATLRDADPESPAGETGLASLRMLPGRWLDALGLWERLCTRSPDDMAPRVGKARALLALGRTDEAEALFDDVLQHPGERAAGLTGLAQVAMRKGLWSMALERWASLAVEPTGAFPAGMGQAQAYEKLGQQHTAERIYETLVNDRPDLPEAHAALVRVRAVRGHQASATAAWESFLERFPERLQGYIGLAQALAAVGQHDKAQAILATASDRFHERLEPGNARAQIEAEQGEDDNAAALWRQQQRLAPWRPELAAALLRLRQVRDGVLATGEAWIAAAERWPYSVPVQLGAIRNAIARDDLEAARALSVKADQQFPGHLALAMAEVNIQMRRSPGGETAMAAVRNVRRQFPEAPEPSIAYVRLYALMYQRHPPELDAICDQVEKLGSPRHMVTLTGLLISTGAFERARAMLDTIETLSDAVSIRALCTKLRARLALFVDQESVSSVLARIDRIPQKIREREGISLPAQAYTVPVDVSSQATKDKTPNGGNIAVLCHIFHRDLLETLMGPLSRLHRMGAVCYFSLSEKLEQSSKVRNELNRSFPDARFVETPNAGFDVGGYWNILSTFESSELRQHENVVILHTKRCAHALRAGDLWRGHLLDAIAGSDQVLHQNLALMRADPRIQMIGSLACVTLSWAAQNNNTPCYLRLRTRVTDAPYTGRLHPFIPGTMFITRMQYLLALHQRLRDVTFEPYDTLDLVHRGDLTAAHAIERLFGTTLGYLGGTARYLDAPARMLLLLDSEKLQLLREPPIATGSETPALS